MVKDSYYVVACKILAYLYKCLRDGSLPNMEILKARNYGINEVYFENVLYMLIKNGYIEGITYIFEFSQTQPIVNLDERVRITQQGIEFYEENNSIRKAIETIKEMKELIPGM